MPGAVALPGTQAFPDCLIAQARPLPAERRLRQDCAQMLYIIQPSGPSSQGI